MPVAFIYDDIFLEHDTGAYHPECADRLRSIVRHVEPLQKELLQLSPGAASYSMLRSVHTDEHINNIEHASIRELALDADTQTSSHSYEAATKAAGAGVLAIDAFKAGRTSAAFAAQVPVFWLSMLSRQAGLLQLLRPYVRRGTMPRQSGLWGSAFLTILPLQPVMPRRPASKKC